MEEYLFDLLEYFSYKYNLSTAGNDFFEVSELCVGSYKSMFYYRNKKTGKYENATGIITPGLSLFNNNSQSSLDFQKVVNTEIPAWNYFINKAKFNYFTYNNVDCVINASIAIESYLIFKIKESNLYKDYLKQNKKKLGFQSALKFCIDNKIIKSDLASIIDNEYNEIALNRSLIIHGVIDSPFIDRTKAKKAYEAIVDVFSTIEQEFSDVKSLNVPSSYFEEDYNNMKKVLIDYENKKYDTAIKQLNDNIEKDIFKDLSIFNRGKCYIALNKSQEAINDFNRCINNNYRLIESYNYIGMELSKLGKHDAAKNIYLKGKKKITDNK